MRDKGLDYLTDGKLKEQILRRMREREEYTIN